MTFTANVVAARLRTERRRDGPVFDGATYLAARRCRTARWRSYGGLAAGYTRSRLGKEGGKDRIATAGTAYKRSGAAASLHNIRPTATSRRTIGDDPPALRMRRCGRGTVQSMMAGAPGTSAIVPERDVPTTGSGELACGDGALQGSAERAASDFSGGS